MTETLNEKALPAGDYAGLVDGLKAWSDDFTGSYEAGVRTICHKAATAIAAQDAKIAALVVERDEARKFAFINGSEICRLRNRAEAAEAQVKAMDEALEPFADIAGEAWADENGWTDAACQNDRVCDWFGPSAFDAARRARAVKGGHADA